MAFGDLLAKVTKNVMTPAVFRRKCTHVQEMRVQRSSGGRQEANVVFGSDV